MDRFQRTAPDKASLSRPVRRGVAWNRLLGTCTLTALVAAPLVADVAGLRAASINRSQGQARGPVPAGQITHTPTPTPRFVAIPLGPSAPSPDEFEPDDAPDLATPLRCAELQQRTIFPSGDQDWIDLTLQDLSGLVFQTNGLTFADTVVLLIDDTGTVIDANDDNDVSGPYARLDRRCGVNALPPGRYRARITAFGDFSVFPYQIDLTCEPCDRPNPTATPEPPPDAFEPDDSPQAARPISCNAEAQERSLLPRGDVDWVEFSLPARSTLQVDAFGVSSFALPIIELYDADLTFLDGALGFVDRRCGVNALDSGSYVLAIRSTGFESYSYRLGITCSPCNVPNPTATPIRSPTPTRTPDPRGNLCASNADCDFFFEGDCTCCEDGRRRCTFFCFPGDCQGPTPTPLPPVCGNRSLDDGEDCDDGNRFGGDGCAANCTFEQTHQFPFRNSFIVVLTTFLPGISVNLSGELTLVVGGPSNGVRPLVIPVNGVQVDPIVIPGFSFCACLYGVDSGLYVDPGFGVNFGSGNSADGSIHCGDDGSSRESYAHSIDRNPSSRFREDSTVRFSGLNPPLGSAQLRALVALGFIDGTCAAGDGNLEKGFDGIPCTSDDPIASGLGALTLTTGGASAFILNADLAGTHLAAGCRADCDQDGAVSAHEITRAMLVKTGRLELGACPTLDDDRSGGVEDAEVDSAAREPFGCSVTVGNQPEPLSGRPFDCQAIERGDRVLNGELAFAFPAAPGIVVPGLGMFDSILAGRVSVLEATPQPPAATPSTTATATATRTRIRTATPTRTRTASPSPRAGTTNTPTGTATASGTPQSTKTPTPCSSQCCADSDCINNQDFGPGSACYCCPVEGLRKCFSPGQRCSQPRAPGPGDGCR